MSKVIDEEKLSSKLSTKKTVLMKHFSTCPHTPDCPSCVLQERENPPLLQEIENFFDPLQCPLGVGKLVEWRCKAKLAVRREGGKDLIGLFKKGSHSLVEIPHCLSHHPSINRAVRICKNAIIKSGLSGYTDKGKGLLRYIQLFVCRKTEKVQLSLVINQEKRKKFTPPFAKFLYLLKKEDWHSIWINYHAKKTNTIFSQEWELFHGKEYLWQDFYHLPFAFHPGVFSQAHISLFEKMISDVEEAIERNAKVLEFFSGIGVIGAHLAKKAQSVCMVEKNPFSQNCFEKSKTKWPKSIGDKIRYINEDAEKVDLSDADHIIFDPPRKGVELSLLRKVFNNPRIKKIIYISCSFPTFKRDASLLLENGYRILFGKGYLLFPGANHIEILCVFEKKSG